MKRTALRRKARLKPRRSKPRRVAPDRLRDPAYRAEVRTLPCASRNLRGARCFGTIEASHQDEGKGMGMKTSDDTCVPQCRVCHLDWTNHLGPFAGWDRARRRLWFSAAVQHTRETIARRREFGVPVPW